ncbi:MAG: exodeoxyribonuclease III, partial [Oligoflexia bacterium]|nr:exodeoxyribonuclease III [Oligoflexia bacterium]
MALVKITSWNVNGIRACTKKGFLGFLFSSQPDILAVQETKARPEQLEKELLEPDGYRAVYCSAEKAGYSGVAVFVRQGIKFDHECGMGIKEFDAEGRTLVTELDDLIFISSYFPNSQDGGARLDYKIAYCNAMLDYMNKLTKKKKPVLLCGDYNIAHTEIDLANPGENRNSPGFLPEERAWMDEFIAAGYIDTFRLFNSEPRNYTWWSYRTHARARNVGWRIDYHCVNKYLHPRVKESYHNTDVMGSDH